MLFRNRFQVVSALAARGWDNFQILRRSTYPQAIQTITVWQGLVDNAWQNDAHAQSRRSVLKMEFTAVKLGKSGDDRQTQASALLVAVKAIEAL